MKKKELELILEKLKPLQKPKLKLEQYTIPSYLAAEILNFAFLAGDLKNKKVADFGCGSGRLAIGAALLGAKEVVGIDLDEEAIQQAKENLKLAENLLGKRLKVKFIRCDVREWKGKCDTVIQNPPFGIKGDFSDRIFLEKAAKSAKKIYSLHRNGREKVRAFLLNFISELGCKVEEIASFSFLLPKTFQFHKKLKKRYDVDLFVISCK
ncbi:MAG: METTL5 family protein [Candidatus Aenigmatarchaeota archaeon]